MTGCLKVLMRADYLILIGACASFLLCGTLAAQVPVAGFQPLVGLSLTDKFKGGSSGALQFSAEDESSLVGNQLGAGGTPFYDLALIDTGAAVSLITAAADASFAIDAPLPGNSDGLRGTNVQQIGGATGFVDALISDALAMFVTGTQNRTSGPADPLTFDTNSFIGQSSVSILTLPAESDLPSIVGIPLLSRYATFIRNDQPQIFQYDGRTVRTPNIEFYDRGTGDQLGISRRVPVRLVEGTGFVTQPIYVFDINSVVGGASAEENPQAPTVLDPRGALFVNVNVQNNGEELDSQFFFDTGADITVLSEYEASQLGFDVILDEPEFTIAVLGSGGVTLDVPGFFADEFTVQAIGGDITATNVPIIVLDVPNPSDLGNVVPGIVGTNLFARRNVVIDPNPALGGGGASPSLYVSDPITTGFNWTNTTASGAWQPGSNWDQPTTPTILGVANVRHVAGDAQQAVLTSDATVWEVNVEGGAGGEQMAVSIRNNATLTTFSGINIRENGAIHIVNGSVDTQFIDMRGGTLSGSGDIFTGNGPLPGQVENLGGVVAPGDGVGTLSIEGRFSNSGTGTLQFEIGGTAPGSQYDQLLIDGDADLAGTLDVSLVALGGGGPFAPTVEMSFTLLQATGSVGGAFENFVLPGQINWGVDFTSDSVVLSVLPVLPGDFNADGRVDAADYTVWLDTLGSQTLLPLNGNGNQIVDAGDWAVWRNNFGAVLDSVVGAAVPEPTALLMALLALFAAGMRNRRTTG